MALALTAIGACSHQCAGSLSEVGAACPATFNGDIDTLACVPYVSFQVYRCGDLLAYSVGAGYGGTTCTYDGTSHALVGAEESADTNSFCGESFTKTAGRNAPVACFQAGPTATKTCPPPDAGTE